VKLRGNCCVQSKLFPAKEKFDWRLFDHDIHLADKGERLGITEDGVDSAAYIAKMRKYVWMATAVFFVLTQFVWPLLTLPAGAVWSLTSRKHHVRPCKPALCRGVWSLGLILSHCICMMIFV